MTNPVHKAGTTNMKAKIKIFAFAIIGIGFLSGCNTGEKEKVQNTQTEVNSVAESAVKAEHNYKIGDQVPNDLVCMVNDAYMAKAQIPIGVNGKIYYGCCNMCVETLNEKETARLAVDPITGEAVDKSEAFIVLLNKNGAVAYYKSEATYKRALEAGKVKS
jgi:YHS domain-containing protein